MRIGEIVETNSMGFVAESFELRRPPAFGSLVKAPISEGRRAYGVVSFVQMAGLDPGRRALRQSTDEIYDEAVYDEQPQLPRIIRTTFDAVFVGWEDADRLWQQLPPQPPPLHFSVQDCEVGEVKQFSDKLYYLRLLLTAVVELPVTRLVIAHVNETYRVRGQDRAWAETVARELAALLKNDNQTLMSILYAIDPG